MSSWLVWDRIRAFSKSNTLYPAERILQDQSSLDKIIAGGEFLDFNHQSAILDQTNLQINRLERYKDYDMMDQTGELSLALDLYADEASLVDPERKHALVIRAGSVRIKRELEELFFDKLLWDAYCRPAIRYLCKFGCFPAEIVLNNNRDAVAALKFINVYNFTRIETRYGDLVGFFYQDEIYPRPVFLHPWQVMHMRLTTFENIYHPYGRSIIDPSRKAFKQLRLMEDAALIYRITRAPEKRKFTIPVGNIPPKEVPEYMQMVGRQFKRKRFYNPTSGTFDENYSPLIQEDDFFMPRRADGTGPDVTTLPGAENLDQIADIEYFKKKMVAPLKIPFGRVGIGDDAGQANDKSLSQSSSEFAKSVQWIQQQVVIGLTKVAIVHLALRGYRVESLKDFELSLSATSAMEELYRIEAWQTRAGVIAELKDIGWFPKEWIITHFTDLTPDEVAELKNMEAIAARGGENGGTPGGLGGGGGGGAGDLPDIPNPDTDGGAEDLEPPEGLEVPPPPGAEADVGGGDLPALEGLEGFDLRQFKKVISEMQAKKDHKAIMEHVENIARRLKKSGRDESFRNAFNYMLESKELDGLSKSKPSTPDKTITEGADVVNPNNDDELIVEWSVDKTARDEAIRDTLRQILCEDALETDDPDDTVVRPEDLPFNG